MCSRRFRMMMVSAPAKTTSVPRSIWNTEAYLRQGVVHDHMRAPMVHLFLISLGFIILSGTIWGVFMLHACKPLRQDGSRATCMMELHEGLWHTCRAGWATCMMELHEGQSEHFKLRVRYKMALTEKVLLTPVRSITMTACGQHVLSLCV